MRALRYSNANGMDRMRRSYRDDRLPRRWPKVSLGPVLVKAAALMALLEMLRVSLQHFYI